MGEGPVLVETRMEDRLTARIALIGLSGAGKSEVAPRVAARLRMETVDLDASVERAAGMSVADLIGTRGEAAFRALESAALRDALAAGSAIPDRGAGDARGAVLALGAGALESRENRALLGERAFVAWLRVEPDTAARRLGAAGAASRPLVREAPETRLRELLESRREGYGAAADVVIDTEGRTAAEVAEDVVAAWEARLGWGSSAS